VGDTKQDLASDESIKAAVSESVQEGGDIRSQVRDLTLQALKTRSLDKKQTGEVVRAVTEGISMGLEKRAGDVKQALSQAVGGLDEALQKAAEATHLALRQLTSQGKDFSENDLRWALDDLKALEQEFVSTLTDVAEMAGAKGKQEFKDLATHISRTGTDTGRKVAETWGEFSSRAKASASSGAQSGKDAAREMAARLAAAASGILAGLSDALHEKSNKPK
jgi:ABC-type transporter Mla subunit MlaD